MWKQRRHVESPVEEAAIVAADPVPATEPLPVGEAPPPDPDAYSRRVVRARPGGRRWLGGGAMAAVAATAAGAGLALTGGSGGPELAADEALADAVSALREAETFSFEREIAGLWDEGPERATGQVHLPDRMRLSSEEPLTHRERIVVGDREWWRVSAFPEVLAGTPWVPESQLAGGVLDALGPDAVIEWLSAVSTPWDQGTDDEGRRVLAGLVRSNELPRLDRSFGGDASVQVTVDEDGTPVHVVLVIEEPRWQITGTYDLRAIGDPVSIEQPSADDLTTNPDLAVHQRDIAHVADVVTPVGLTQLPETWGLSRAAAAPGRADPDCASVELVYQGRQTGPEGTAFSTLFVMTLSRACAEPVAEGDELRAGDHLGSFVADRGRAELSGRLPFDPSLDTAVLQFEIDDQYVVVLADVVADLVPLMASLGPVDPAAQPRSPLSSG